jgi:hypothetical protein
MEDFIVMVLIQLEDIAHRWLAHKGKKWSGDESAASELWGGFEQILCSEVPRYRQTSRENTNLKDPTPSDKWFIGLKAACKSVFLDFWIISCL